MLYTVKEVARMTGLTPYTVRYYLKEGLFPAVERDSRGTRLFREEDIESFYMIECLKRCGMTISEMRQYVDWLVEGDGNIDKCLSLFLEKQKVLERKMAELSECLDAVRYKVWYYQTAKEASTISVHDEMPPEDIPDVMREIRSRMAHVDRLNDNAKPDML